MAKIITDEQEIEKVLTRGVENIYPEKDFLKKILLSGKQITLYCGFDPNSPTLHIGHGIAIRKLAQFQQLGHNVIFLFGDFTGQIGDPDKLSTRVQINHKQVLENLKGWKKQISNLIDIDKIDFRFNSKWLSKLTFTDLISIAKNFTVQRLIERDMFQERMKIGRPIYLHEFFYPLMQAYDSVEMDVDLEIGGNDQTFNMLCGRDLIKSMKNKEKAVLTVKLLADPTGKKMGKSEGNMVTLADTPSDMYGKIMSWPDTMISTAFEILTDVPIAEIADMEKQMTQGVNPKDFKMKLAKEVVNIYLGEDAAREAENNFVRVFQEGLKPTDISEVKIDKNKLQDGKIGVLDLFVLAGVAQSNGEMRRLIKENAIRINDEIIVNEKHEVEITADGLLLQRGKKIFVRVSI